MTIHIKKSAFVLLSFAFCAMTSLASSSLLDKREKILETTDGIFVHSTNEYCQLEFHITKIPEMIVFNIGDSYKECEMHVEYEDEKNYKAVSYRIEKDINDVKSVVRRESFKISNGLIKLIRNYVRDSKTAVQFVGKFKTKTSSSNGIFGGRFPITELVELVDVMPKSIFNK